METKGNGIHLSIIMDATVTLSRVIFFGRRVASKFGVTVRSISLISLIAAAVFMSGGKVEAQPTDFSITGATPGLTQGTFTIQTTSLAAVSDLSAAGAASRQYYSVFFTPSSSQSYVFGQTFSAQDTVMFLVSGVFDPNNPGTGAPVLNDDTPQADHQLVYGALPGNFGCGNNTGFCPQITRALTAGTTYSLVVTTYSTSDATSFTLPQNFYAVGPGTFSASAPSDTTAPTLVSSSPADNATGVALNSNIVLTFSENIQAGTGNIIVSDGAGDTRTIPVGDAQITIVGTTLTINPTADLNQSSSYYVQIGSTAIEDVAGNSYAGIADTTTLNFSTTGPAQTPATEFAAEVAHVRQILTDDADRVLRSLIATNRLTVEDARERFILARSSSALASRNDIPFDIDGAFSLSGATLSSNGTFFGQQGSADGTYRRLFFGDFDIQRDGNSGSNTATLTARVAWERITSENTMLGYFVGAELADSDIKGSFVGEQSRVAVTVGGYAVHQLNEQVYLDGFLTFGAGRNDLDMSTNALVLTGDYTTRSATIGAALSGLYTYEQYDFRPELALSYGRTWIGTVGFTGRAFGLVDDTLSLDAGSVSITNLTLRPEVIWALDSVSVAESNTQLSFAPRVICERSVAVRTTEECGGGAELGLSSLSQDGLTNAEFRVINDRVGNNERTSYAISLEHQF
jgi:methionine-rich copper-binding protein CopC